MPEDNGNKATANGKTIKANASSRQQVIDLLNTITQKEILVFPQGSSSKKIFPIDYDRQLLVLNLQKLDKMNRLQTADFYVDCQAGITLTNLYQVLKEKNLQFPFLEADSRGTVGGMVGSGRLISQGLCYSVSRWIIAATVVMADSQVINTGAVTFKSVAGYNLPRLFCGSFGTLGVFTDLVLRCYPAGAQPYGKDLEPVEPIVPILSFDNQTPSPGDTGGEIAQKIKQEFDPDGIFPVISGWN